MGYVRRIKLHYGPSSRPPGPLFGDSCSTDVQGHPAGPFPHWGLGNLTYRYKPPSPHHAGWTATPSPPLSQARGVETGSRDVLLSPLEDATKNQTVNGWLMKRYRQHTARATHLELLLAKFDLGHLRFI